MKTHLFCSGNILKNCPPGLTVRRAEHGDGKKRGKEIRPRMLNQGIEWAGKDRDVSAGRRTAGSSDLHAVGQS